jgi:hypothetical protein
MWSLSTMALMPIAAAQSTITNPFSWPTAFLVGFIAGSLVVTFIKR